MRQGAGLNRAKDEEEEKSDDDVHHRPRDRDREFLRRFLWHARHACHSSYRQQDYVGCLDPKTPGHEDMAEFVENDAGENENNEKHAVARRGKPSLLPGTYADPGEEEKEGEMHPHGRCTEAADRQGPKHEPFSSSISYGRFPLEERTGVAGAVARAEQTALLQMYIYHPLMQMRGLRRATLRAR